MAAEGMTPPGNPEARTTEMTRVGLRRTVAGVMLALAAVSVVHDRFDVGMRNQAEDFMRRFGLDARRPLDLQSMQLEPAGDLAADVAVDGALRDLDAAIRSGATPSNTRATGQLAAAQELMLDAISKRPGSVHHLLLLGEAAHAEQALAGGGEPASPETSLVRIALWARPLRVAASAAPGADATWEALATSYLASWNDLASENRFETTSALRRAFRNPDFAGREFPRAVSLLGSEGAIRLLPDAAKPLRAALRSTLAAGDVATAGLLTERADRAERKKRSADLLEIEAQASLGDVDGVRHLCQIWSVEHGIQDFDDSPGRTQVARLLDLWPAELVGDWNTDRRGELVTFFLEKNAPEAKPEAIARSVAALSGAPATTRARAKLLVGQLEDAETIAAESSAGSLEWTPYFVALARFQRLRGHALEAREVLDRANPLSRDDCDVILERREIVRALGDTEAVEAVRRSVALRLPSDLGAGWSADSTISLCVDPEATVGGRLEVELAASLPAFVIFGWDGGRLGSLVVATGRTLSVPLSGVAGRRTFWIRALAGGPVRPVATRLKPLS